MTKVNDVVKQNGIAIFEGMLDGLRTALAEGVVIGTGTDSACTYVTHYSLWRELDYLVRFGGMTPAQALHAATQTNADILGWGEITGRVEEGFAADLVVVDANPLESFRNLSAPHMVIARGHLIEEPAFETLDELDVVLDGI
ncbi:amidohydrolase family protein [Corynebacterium sp. HMSC05E07]|uniref:amidohydrolase family protein n=1 Tax=Corynebacterium sp. HMSC05E07 TaxID=1581117 RepID=UPI000AA1EA36|nr:amidohydrolase family protein [Corynebacterium sp. HMSC05E07]